MKILKQHDLKGLGGILLDDVQESLPNHEKVLKVRLSKVVISSTNFILFSYRCSPMTLCTL